MKSSLVALALLSLVLISPAANAVCYVTESNCAFDIGTGPHSNDNAHVFVKRGTYWVSSDHSPSAGFDTGIKMGPEEPDGTAVLYDTVACKGDPAKQNHTSVENSKGNKDAGTTCGFKNTIPTIDFVVTKKHPGPGDKPFKYTYTGDPVPSKDACGKLAGLSCNPGL